MDISFEIVRSVEQFVSGNREIIMIATAILAAVCAITILTIYFQALPAQRWAKYFGLAFTVFAVQYLVRVLAPEFLNDSAPRGSWNDSVESVSRILTAACSILNNLFFLATARELLGKKTILGKRNWFIGKRNIEMLAFQPRWVWVLALASLTGFAPVTVCPWCRLPDALFSAFCLFSVGYALSLNLKLRPRSFLSTTAIAISFIYAFFLIQHGFNPFLALTDFAGIPGFEDRLRFLDAVDWAVLLPLNFGLFITALVLLIKSLVVVSLGDVEKMSRRVIKRRAEYLESGGILKSIGESVQADSVELFIKAPSTREQCMYRLKWEQDHSAEYSSNQEALPSNKETIEGWILLDGVKRRGDFKARDARAKTNYEVYPGNDRATEYVLSIEDDSFTIGVPISFHDFAFLAWRSKLEVRPDERGHRIGKLILAVPSEKDEPGRPILATNESYRSTVASVVADSLLDFVREYLSSVLKNLSVRLNSRNAMNVSGWLYGVEEAARSVGLLWVVAEQTGNDSLAGSLEAVRVIEEEIIRKSPKVELQGEGTQLRYVPFDPCKEAAHGVVEVRLSDTGKRIWFGVARTGFGEELDFPSPWKVFLEHFAEIADSALIRLTAAMDMDNLRIQAAQYQGLATVAVTTGTIIHQIVNMAKDLSSGISTLLDARSAGILTYDEDYNRIISAMSNSADRLLELTSNITNVTKLDERRPCSLLDAVIQSKKLFEFSLSQREIELENKVPFDLMIDVPFHVAALTIANLISNAKDAIGTRGRIVIEAEESGDIVDCVVTDNGPGVSPQIRERMFHLGVTTKRNSGGWGLYLVARSLRENGGSIEISSTGPEGTKFTIRFPKERREATA